MQVDNPRGLAIRGLAPSGALPGCPGHIILNIDRNDCGSWSTACSMDLSLDCDARGCWWSRDTWTGDVDAELFAEAEVQHTECATGPEALAMSADAGTSLGDGGR